MKKKFIFLNKSNFQSKEFATLLAVDFLLAIVGSILILEVEALKPVPINILVVAGFILTPYLITLILLLLDVYIITGHKSVYLGGYLYIFSKKYHRCRVYYNEIQSIILKIDVTPKEENTKGTKLRAPGVKLVDYYIVFGLKNGEVKELFINDFSLKKVETILFKIRDNMEKCNNLYYADLDIENKFKTFSEDINCYLD